MFDKRKQYDPTIYKILILEKIVDIIKAPQIQELDNINKTREKKNLVLKTCQNLLNKVTDG